MLLLFFLSSLLVSETLYTDWKQTLTVEEMIHEEKSDHWNLSIFKNAILGNVLSIDGVIQLTENDEFIYHEIMAHVPLLTHPNPTSLLIIGGGDGGLLREAVRHQNLEKIVQVEIDERIIDVSKKYLPNISKGSFEDPRVTLIIQDGAKYVKETKDKFDVILCDSNDPEGPAKVLFSSEFYRDCKNILKPQGIFVNQNGVPFLQKNMVEQTLANRRPSFKQVSFFIAPVPTYIGGFMAFGWASDKKYRVSEKILRERLSKIKGEMKYYTPEIHRASFALPAFIKRFK